MPYVLVPTILLPDPDTVCCDSIRLQLLIASQLEQATSIASLSTSNHCLQEPQHTYFTP